jgi:hypothetical protein
MVFVSNGAESNEEIDASTAAVLLATVSSLFGPGVVRDSKGRIITVESGDVAGQYTWSTNASGEGGNDVHDGSSDRSH